MKTVLVAALLAAATITGIHYYSSSSQNDQSLQYGELYRPGFHFTAPKNWINDPNGLVYFQGEYHLFFQYNPQGDYSGHQNWGHAVSKDLTHWENLPIALPEYNGWWIWSGGAVADEKNSSGFCTSSAGCMVAMFTTAKDGSQTQSIAYSNDLGRTWTYYANNPVIDEKLADFRDPKVFWHEPTSRWVVVTALASISQVRFYSSPDLIHWTRLSEFGPEGLDKSGWECPDLYQIPIEGTNQTRWILSMSYYTDRPRIAYFMGDFNGTNFNHTDPVSPFTSFLDHGKDYYAAVTWNNAPNGRRLQIGWLSNWGYAGATPTSPWRGAQSFVRELKLRNSTQGLRLESEAVSELADLRSSQPASLKNFQLDSSKNSVAAANVVGAQLELNVTFSFNRDAYLPKEFGLKVFVGDKQETVIGYNVENQTLFVDRTNSGKIDFNSGFPGRSDVKAVDNQGTLSLHVLIDQSSVEVFNTFNAIAITNLIFPDPQKNAVQFYVTDGQVNVDSFDAWTIKSVWNQTSSTERKSVRGSIAI